MPADADSQQDGSWPVPQFRFEVDFGTGLNAVAFQEVTGLDVENAIIEYRKGNSPSFSTTKMPGIRKSGNITLKRGVFSGDTKFWQWHEQISKNQISKRTISIRLLDEGGQVMMQWQLKNAWPTKITSTDLNSDGNEVAVETLEIAHEGLTVSNG